MISKTSDEKLNNSVVSLSYNGSVQRIAGLGSELIKLPSKLVEERRNFWLKFFSRHSENILDDQEIHNLMLEPYTKPRVYKPLSHIQHWIDTGYFPYNTKQFNMDEDAQSDSGSVSELEICFESLRNANKEKASDQPNHKDNFSSSSVDTTAYILSNLNVTKKAETIAIVEGAKSNAILQPQNIRSTSTMRGNACESTPNRACEQTNKNIFNDNNDNQKQSCMEASQSELRQNNGTEKNVIQVEENLDADVSQSTLSIDDKEDELSQSYYNKLIYKRLAQTLKSPYRKYNTERSSLNINFTSRTQNLSPIRLMKQGHRKKLYTGRDSPVDLVNMSSSNGNSLSKARHSSHPALDLGYKKGFKMKKLSRIRCFSLFNNSSQLFKQPRRRKKEPASKKISTTTDSLRTDAVTVNNTNVNNSAVDEHVDRNFLQDLDTSFATDVSKENKSKSATSLEKTSRSKESMNAIPVVCLMKLSKDEIEKYTRSNRKTVDSLNTSALSRRYKRNNFGSRRKSMSRKKKSNRTTSSISTETNSGQSYKNSNDATVNWNPVVWLERMPEIEILKYKGVTSEESNIYQSTIQLLPLPNIAKYTSIDDEIVLRRNVSSETTKSYNENVTTNRPLRYNKSLYLPRTALNVINVTTEDSSSDSSTLLFYKCDKTEHNKYRLGNGSAVEADKSSTRCTRRKRSDRIKQNTSKQSDEEIEVGQNRRSKRSKIEARNQMTLNDNVRTNEVETKNKPRSQPDLNVSLTSTHSHGYKTRSRNSEELRNIDNSDHSILTKDTNQMKNSLVAPRRLGMVYKGSSSSSSSSTSNNVNVINKNKSKEISHNLFSSDEDGFVKLVRCPEDIGKMELKKRYKLLTQEFNNSEQPQDDSDLHAVHESQDNKSQSKFITKSPNRTGKDFVSMKRNRFSKRSSSSPAKDDYEKEFEKKETMNSSRREVLVLLNKSVSQNKTKTTRLRFTTRLFESDSESSKMSHCSSNKLSLRDEE